MDVKEKSVEKMVSEKVKQQEGQRQKRESECKGQRER